MNSASPFHGRCSAPIADALVRQGFTALTPIQEAVLDPALAGRDLRIRSQTGSGKTVAVGLVLAAELEAPALEGAPLEAAKPARPAARPRAILIAPTRELAAQLARELTWLFAPIGAAVRAVTGGTGYAHELRALRDGPRVIVGTPGRLLDHLERGSIDPSGTTAVVLDEADQMLDLGFREDLTAILGKIPEARRTHLVSATFSREVRALADRYQRDAVDAEGAARGEANQDIAHVAHLVRTDERDAALINLLLLAPGERTLVFVRTREGASTLADRLADAGFRARPIHGDLDQPERTRTLDAFRSGAITTLVATDVAARGIDVPEVSRVIHADPPTDADVFTHRSGRTGRAGRKGTSIVLAPPPALEFVRRLFRFARVEATFLPAPSPDDVRRAADARLRDEIMAAAPNRIAAEAPASASALAEGPTSASALAEGPTSASALAEGPASASAPAESAPIASGPRRAVDPSIARLRPLAEQLLGAIDPTDLVAMLLARAEHTGPCAPLPVTPIAPSSPRPARAPRPEQGPFVRAPRGEQGPFVRAPRGEQGPFVRAPQGEQQPGPLNFVPFRINWGERHGADARRLLALVCRRGGIKGSEVGAIRIGDTASTFEVASAAAAGFERSVKRPDARDPRIRIDLVNQAGAARPQVNAGPPVSDARPAPRDRSGQRIPYTHPRTRVAPPA